MRVIKFRAKISAEKNRGEWAYGEFAHDDIGNAFIHFWFEGPEYGYWTHRSVDEKTLGQFTGLTDKNGKEIYEGDVVNVYDCNRGCEECDLIDKGVKNTHQHDCENHLCTQQIKWSGDGGYFCDEDTGEFCPPLGSDEIELEVIGNIYENPELLNNK